ncbi:hypothetical protein SAMN04488587_1631 [Methanococcoides vulcani]|uniref:Uncharacterized protein n=1 Tax=Methanococcoides vulcani TaxID=1353158 RepID=A0A1I0AF95_9EURY|nr:hypothetical protein SAMN04488587_1631 [Methanococcoides vulcani]
MSLLGVGTFIFRLSYKVLSQKIFYPSALTLLREGSI